jgi:hypothetical protein
MAVQVIPGGPGDPGRSGVLRTASNLVIEKME